MQHERMSDAEVVATLEQLVEASQDRDDTANEINNYKASVGRPVPATHFDDLEAFLDFHRRTQEWDDGLSEREAARSAAEEAYREATRRLSRVLPSGCSLRYTYEGEREDLKGVQYTIVNAQGKVSIRWHTRPASPP